MSAAVVKHVLLYIPPSANFLQLFIREVNDGILSVWRSVSLCGRVSVLTQGKVVYLGGQCDINQCCVVCVYIGLG